MTETKKMKTEVKAKVKKTGVKTKAKVKADEKAKVIKLNGLKARNGIDSKALGRGIGSGKGKTSTFGHKGGKARSGRGKVVWFEGGQMPLYRRLPKRGFKNALFRTRYTTVNVEELNVFEDGTVVTPALLKDKRIIRKTLDGVKILGNGKLEKKLTIQANKFSNSALEKIKEAGSKAEVI